MLQKENQQIFVIQYLRGIAAILVVLFHSTMMTAVAPFYTHHFGSIGVDLFFVISGFVMWTATSGLQRGPILFWRARVFRIAPMYWIATLTFVAVTYFLPSALLHPRTFDVAHILKSLFFIPSNNISVNAIVPTYTIGWTLNYEMFFYFIFGLSLLIKNCTFRAISVAATLILICTFGKNFPANPIISFYSNPVLMEFIAGMFIAINRKKFFELSEKYGALLLLLSMGFIVSSYDRAGFSWLNVLGCTLLVAGSLPFESIVQSKSNKFFVLIGDASYSIYLFHGFFQRALFIILGGKIASLADAVIYSVLALLIGTIGGILTYQMIERPIIRMLKIRVTKVKTLSTNRIEA